MKEDTKKIMLTLSVPDALRKKLKIYAAQNDTTISALLEKWYYEATQKDKNK